MSVKKYNNSLERIFSPLENMLIPGKLSPSAHPAPPIYIGKTSHDKRYHRLVFAYVLFPYYNEFLQRYAIHIRLETGLAFPCLNLENFHPIL